MKLASHKALGISIGLYANYNVYGVIGITIGSILPDIIDIFLSGSNNKFFSIIHRKISHWWLVYAVLIYLSYHKILYHIVINQAVFYISFGAIIHILFDSLTKSGVPLLNPFKQDLKIGVITTGSILEYIVVTIITTTLLYVKYHRI